MKVKILYMDPPWSYPNNLNDQGTKAFHSYKKLTLAELKKLPVPALLESSGLLFSWWTGPMAVDCVDLMKTWEMDIINMFAFVWVKLNRKTQAHVDVANNVWTFDGGFFGYGAGGYTVTNVEAVLVARPKKSTAPIPRIDARQRQLVFSSIGNRSRKPEEVRQRIEKMYGMREQGIVGVELFATERHPGWVSLGNEIDGRDIRDSLPHLIQCPETSYDDAEFFPSASLLQGISPSSPQS